MASLTRHRRRLLRWRRYADRTRRLVPRGHRVLPMGHFRAALALAAEQERRTVRDVYWPTAPDRCYCVGCIGMGPCDDAFDRDEDYACQDDPQCPCGGDCWDDLRPIETVTAFAERGLL